MRTIPRFDKPRPDRQRPLRRPSFFFRPANVPSAIRTVRTWHDSAHARA